VRRRPRAAERSRPRRCRRAARRGSPTNRAETTARNRVTPPGPGVSPPRRCRRARPRPGHLTVVRPGCAGADRRRRDGGPDAGRDPAAGRPTGRTAPLAAGTEPTAGVRGASRRSRGRRRRPRRRALRSVGAGPRWHADRPAGGGRRPGRRRGPQAVAGAAARPGAPGRVGPGSLPPPAPVPTPRPVPVLRPPYLLGWVLSRETGPGKSGGAGMAQCPLQQLMAWGVLPPAQSVREPLMGTCA
jgi:hypothetical protein